MSFIPGNIVKEYEVDGKKVRLRYPKWEDLKHLHEYINSLVKERALIGMQKPISMENEIDWLSDKIKKAETGNVIMLIVEVNGKVVGSSEIKKKELDANKHVGTLAIGLRKEFRGMGIGKEMMNSLASIAKKELGIRIIESSYYELNNASERLHKSCGFKEVGRIPKGCNYYGKYRDEIIMYKEL